MERFYDDINNIAELLRIITRDKIDHLLLMTFTQRYEILILIPFVSKHPFALSHLSLLQEQIFRQRSP